MTCSNVALSKKIEFNIANKCDAWVTDQLSSALLKACYQ